MKLFCKLIFSLPLMFTNAQALNIELLSGESFDLRVVEAGGALLEKDKIKVKVKGYSETGGALFLNAGSDTFKLSTIPVGNIDTTFPKGNEFVELDGIIGELNVLLVNTADSHKIEENCTLECIRAKVENRISNLTQYQVVDSSVINYEPTGDVGGRVFDELRFFKVPKKGLSEKSMKLAQLIASSPYSATRGATEVKVFNTASPSVVLIENEADDSIGSGSAIERDRSGRVLILTNYHVIEGSDEVNIYLRKGNSGSPQRDRIYRAEVVKTDPYKDLAIIRTKEKVMIPLLKIDMQSELQIGQDVHAIGHPKGEFWTYTKGYISQIRDELPELDGIKFKLDKIIQTQTPINPGNSGGPLLNDKGEMVGVNFIKGRGEAIGFAISTGDVDKFLKSKTQHQQIAKKEDPDEGVTILSTNMKDLDKDGTEEFIAALDLDGDGVRDAIVVVNSAKKHRILYVDKNHNKKYERKAVDRDMDGKYELTLDDLNEDGKWDIIGYDTDGDGETDKFETYEG